MTFLDNLKEETTVGRTANGAKTFTSTLNANVDFYAQAGSMRQNKSLIKSLFAKAYDEDREIALRNLIHLRNIRLGGLGERDAFRIAVEYLIDAKDYKAITMIAEYVGYFGRWDDLVAIMAKDSKTFDIGISVIQAQLKDDLDAMEAGDSVSLMAKWIPNVNVKNVERRKMANRIYPALGFKSPRDYRKTLVALRSYIGVLEVKLAAKDYKGINFEKLPSKALFRYRAAFNRHLGDEYRAFIEAVNNGEVQMNGSLVMPHEIVTKYETGLWSNNIRPLDPVLEATWKSMDDVLKDVEDNAIVVADTSASMKSTSWGSTVTPWSVAEGLAIYTSEKLAGAFKNNFITFSTRPQLVTLPEHGTLRDKVVEYHNYSIVSSTNIERVFDLILNTAVKNKTPQAELPSKIIIISDMEFNTCTADAGVSNFEHAKNKFNEHGYELPSLVFWNVNASGSNVPVRFNEQGVALVSGFSTNVLTTVLGGEITSPEQMMLNVLNKPEYDFVKLGL